MQPSNELSASYAGIHIRCAIPHDRAALVAARGNASFWQECGFVSRAAYEALVSQFTDPGAAAAGCHLFVISLVHDPGPVGLAYVSRGQGGYGRGAGGLFCAEERGSEVAQTALVLAMDLCFRLLGLNHIRSLVWANNPRALRFWMKLGFHVEGWERAQRRPPGAPPIRLNIGATAEDFFASTVATQILG